MKKLIAFSVITLVMTGSTAAYGALIKSSTAVQSQETQEQLVTIPTPKITYPIQKVEILSGPIKESPLLAGPIIRNKTPEMGSLEWLAQQKLAQDEFKSDAEKKQEELEAEIARLEKIAEDTKILNETLALVKKQIGITPWVFGGSTPGAWDCSGLVRWTYAHLGVDLEHRASVQRLSGEIVTKPKIGDLVSFNFQNYGSAYHIGIYVGPDEMLHAGGKPGDRTQIRSIKNWSESNGNSEVIYTRIIETNN